MELKVDLPSLAGQDIDPDTFQRVWNRVMPDQTAPAAREEPVPGIPDTAIPVEPCLSCLRCPTVRRSRSARNAPPAPSVPTGRTSRERFRRLKRPPSAWERPLRGTASGWRS